MMYTKISFTNHHNTIHTFSTLFVLQESLRQVVHPRYIELTLLAQFYDLLNQGL